MALGFGKSPFEIQPGDRLRSANVLKVARAKVVSVDGPNTNGQLIIRTDEETHTFEPGQAVAFPRRSNGQTKIHLDPKPSILEVKIGDVVAGPEGWKNLSGDLDSGRLITDIQPSRRFGGFLVSYRSVRGKGGKMIVGIDSGQFYGPDYLEFDQAEVMVSKSRFTPEPKNASGVYRNLVSGQDVRFRIAGIKGRPPHCDLRKSPGTNIADWDEWQLMSGKRHPEDPRG